MDANKRDTGNQFRQPYRNSGANGYRSWATIIDANTAITDRDGKRYGTCSAYRDSDGSTVVNIYTDADIALNRHTDAGRAIHIDAHTDADGNPIITVYSNGDTQLRAYAYSRFGANADQGISAERHTDTTGNRKLN